MFLACPARCSSRFNLHGSVAPRLCGSQGLPESAGRARAFVLLTRIDQHQLYGQASRALASKVLRVAK